MGRPGDQRTAGGGVLLKESVDPTFQGIAKLSLWLSIKTLFLFFPEKQGFLIPTLAKHQQYPPQEKEIPWQKLKKVLPNEFNFHTPQAIIFQRYMIQRISRSMTLKFNPQCMQTSPQVMNHQILWISFQACDPFSFSDQEQSFVEAPHL